MMIGLIIRTRNRTHNEAWLYGTTSRNCWGIMYSCHGATSANHHRRRAHYYCFPLLSSFPSVWRRSSSIIDGVIDRPILFCIVSLPLFRRQPHTANMTER